MFCFYSIGLHLNCSQVSHEGSVLTCWGFFQAFNLFRGMVGRGLSWPFWSEHWGFFFLTVLRRKGSQGSTCERAAVLKWNQHTSTRALQSLAQQWLTVQSALLLLCHTCCCLCYICWNSQRAFFFNEGEKYESRLRYMMGTCRSPSQLKGNHKYYKLVISHNFPRWARVKKKAARMPWR